MALYVLFPIFQMQKRMLTVFAGLLALAAPAALLAHDIAAEDPPPQPGQLAQPEQAPHPGQVVVASKLPYTLTATPLTTREKFSYRVIQSFGLKGFLGSALSAGISQWDDSPHEWGQGAEGYGLRYGSSFGANLTRQTFSWGLESALHEDSRYFPSVDKRNKKQRLANALKQVFLTKKDDGTAGFAYARVASAFGAGQFVNVWQPKSNNSFSDGLERFVISLGGDAGYNLLQEFFPFARPIALRHNKPSAPTTP